MTKIDWSPVLDLFDQHERFALTTHVEPDGDGLGAEVALYRYLTSRDKEVAICNVGQLSPHFAYLAESAPFEWVDRESARTRLDWAEVLLVVDTCDPSRLGPITELLDGFSGPIVAIDHHLFDHGLSPITIRDPQASSTGEMIHNLLTSALHPIDPPTAEALFTSLVTDTGWLRFEKTSPAVLRIAADLVEAGARPYDLFSRIHDILSWDEFGEQLRILHTTQSALDGRVGIAVINLETYERAGTNPGSAEEILNAILSIEPVEVALLLTEIRHQHHRISLRSRGRVNVAEVAASLGGGGHHSSAGTQLPGDRDQVEQTVLNALIPRMSRGTSNHH